jgi:hypothetical protein
MATPANYATLIAEIDAIVDDYTLSIFQVFGGKPANLVSLLQLIDLRYKLFEAGGGSGATAGLVLELTASQQTRAANTTPYAAGDAYFSVGSFATGLTAGSSLLIQRFQALIDISAIPSGMALRVIFFASDADARVSGLYIDDNATLENTLPNAANPANGFPLTITDEGGKVLAVSGDINHLFRLKSGETSIFYYLEAAAAFTPAANSETMTCKAVIGTY